MNYPLDYARPSGRGRAQDSRLSPHPCILSVFSDFHYVCLCRDGRFAPGKPFHNKMRSCTYKLFTAMDALLFFSDPLFFAHALVTSVVLLERLVETDRAGRSTSIWAVSEIQKQMRYRGVARIRLKLGWSE